MYVYKPKQYSQFFSFGLGFEYKEFGAFFSIGNENLSQGLNIPWDYS